MLPDDDVSADDQLFELEMEELEAGLLSLEPNPRRRHAPMIKRLYPTITRKLAEGVSQKNILAFLCKRERKIHPATFKDLLAAEKTRREGVKPIDEGGGSIAADIQEELATSEEKVS